MKFSKLLSSLLAAFLCVPALFVIAAVFNLSNQRVSDFNTIIRFFEQKFLFHTCSGSLWLDNCLVERNTLFFSLVFVVFLVLVVADLLKNRFKIVGSFISNAEYVVLVGPLLYYLFIYLPGTWRANNPMLFFILCAVCAVHVIAVACISRLTSGFFKAD